MKKPLNVYHYPTPAQLAELCRRHDETSFIDHTDILDQGVRRFADEEKGVRGCFADDCASDDYDGFVWITHKGVRYTLPDMSTPHMFYALRMIFNHSIPPVFRIGGSFKRYDDVPQWTPEYRREALEVFAEELTRRGDLEENLQYQFEDIQANARVILALGL